MRLLRAPFNLLSILIATTFLTIPAMAQTTISNIDDSSAWLQPGTSTPNFFGNANLSWMAQNVTTAGKQLDGASQEFHVGSNGPAFGTGLWWATFTPESNATTFQLDLTINTDQNFASVAQAIEFGVEQALSGVNYRMDVQCDFVGGAWSFYNPSTSSWTSSNRNCVAFTPGWNHLTFNFQRTTCPAGMSSPSGQCVQWTNMIINGTTYPITDVSGSNLFSPGVSTAESNNLLNILQLDLNSANAPYEVYTDEVSLTTNGTPDGSGGGGGPLPTPPSNAASFPDLQVAGGGNPGTWTLCSGTTCAGGQNGGSSSLQFSQQPALSSSGSMKQTSTGTGFNTMYYRHLGCPNNNCAAVKNMLEDMYFQPASTTNIEQLEFDPDLYNAGFKYFASVACRLKGTNSGFWYLWNSAGDFWDATTFPCTASTILAGNWHHFQLYVTFDTSTQSYTYQTFVFDGTTVFQNLGKTYSALNLHNTATNTNIEQQIDNDSSTNPTNSVYYDKYNLWIW
ncbi:MAG: hypothetical protein DMG65_03190 [Candidatus Angelobacter sp. Gp1-AA117]|nr:MAG: hypothetical protein DMG65_03190 [Candidatus Angelobacter sp. Gp1-AA117]